MWWCDSILGRWWSKRGSSSTRIWSDWRIPPSGQSIIFHFRVGDGNSNAKRGNIRADLLILKQMEMERERERERNETKFPWHWIVRVKRWWRCLSVGSKMIFVGCRRRPSSGVSSPGEETFSNRRLGADGCSRFKRHYHKIWFSLSIFSNDFPITRGCIN